MKLKILLPVRTFVDVTDVLRIVARGTQGAFGVLPHRLDCAVALVPSLFLYETAGAGETVIAVDEGVLVKIGDEVTVAVRNAIGNVKLGEFRQTIEGELFRLDEQEKTIRGTIARLETGIARKFIQLKRHA